MCKVPNVHRRARARLKSLRQFRDAPVQGLSISRLRGFTNLRCNSEFCSQFISCYVQDSMFLIIILNHVFLSDAFSLLDVEQIGFSLDRERLHSLDPRYYRREADIRIDNINKWHYLNQGNCRSPATQNVVLVELQDMCFLPLPEAYENITTNFILFGPFHSQHHANFGPFTELDSWMAGIGKGLIEAHLRLKFARCSDYRSVHDILALLNHPKLVHWAAQQHSIVQHSKIHAIPLGFGYCDVRLDRNLTSLSHYKNQLVKFLRSSDEVKREKLLLVTMQIHTNLFGNTGQDPRSEALRNLSESNSLRKWSVNQHFSSTEEYWSALRQHKFVLSPWGWGPDCFRHYEAIAIGTIPVVLSDYMADMALEGLPVLRVQSWRELSADMLEREYIRINRIKTWQMSRLLRKNQHSRLFQHKSTAQQICNFKT